MDSECRSSRRNMNPFDRRRGSVNPWCVVARSPLLLERKAMQHVQQCLLVHCLVFEDRECCLAAVEQRMPGAIDLGVRERVEYAPIRFVDEPPRDSAIGPESAGMC